MLNCAVQKDVGVRGNKDFFALICEALGRSVGMARDHDYWAVEAETFVLELFLVIEELGRMERVSDHESHASLELWKSFFVIPLLHVFILAEHWGDFFFQPVLDRRIHRQHNDHLSQ